MNWLLMQVKNMLIIYNNIISVDYCLKQEYTNVIYKTHRYTFWLNRKVKCKEGWYENWISEKYIDDILNYIPKKCYIEEYKVYYLPHLIIKDITGEYHRIYFNNVDELLKEYNSLKESVFSYETNRRVEQDFKG